jgi:adenylate kinase
MAAMRKRLLLLGPPGSGKGTQAERLSQALGVPVLGTGDLLRDAIARGTELGLKAKEFVDSGRLVPDDIIIQVMRERMQAEDAREGFILDGFPRTVPQAEGLDRILRELGYELQCVLEIAVDEEAVVERMVNRRICPSCGKVYNLKSSPPAKDSVCDDCGAALIQRSDDRPETIRERMRVYRESTAPLREFYEERGLLRTVDGNGSVEEVFGRILEVLENGGDSKG